MAPLHVTIMRELGAALRQVRVNAGFEDLKAASRLLNEVIEELHPGAAGSRTAYRGRRSDPHPVTARYLSGVERGTTSSLSAPSWSVESGYTDDQLRTGIVPQWLVRCYDDAFLADGYLVDMYLWAELAALEHRREPPGRSERLPVDLTPAAEAALICRDFPEQGAVGEILARNVRDLLARRDTYDDRSAWVPQEGDASASFGEGEEDNPEGSVLAPGQMVVMRWVLRNVGTVAWRNRILYRVGLAHVGLITPALLAIPDTAPGGVAVIDCPVRAPLSGGTYRVCMKAGWPDGSYCFPNTLVGVIFTAIVLTGDLAGCLQPFGTTTSSTG